MKVEFPKVYGDRIIPLLVKVDRELQVMEIAFIEDEKLSVYDNDVQDYGRVQHRLREIYEDLRMDRIRGETAVERIRIQVFVPFQDLCYRLVESKRFPEFWELYEFLETY
jgi:hypothetical protein